jgi:hypothetical protein
VRALLHSRAAWTFALDGDAEATARNLRLAEEALAQRNSQTPDNAAWVDETELAIMTGRCWSELRRPLRAVPVLGSALTRYSDAHSRGKALYSSWLTDSYIDAGEIEQATAVVTSSLEIMGNVASVRPRQRLAAVTSRLSEHRVTPSFKRPNGLFDFKRAPSVSSLTIGGSAGCNATVPGADSSPGSETRTRPVSPA